MGERTNTPGVHCGMELLASADVSKDMAENLLRAFEGLPGNSILRLEIRDFGVWITNRSLGAPIFIGSMQPPLRKGKSH